MGRLNKSLNANDVKKQPVNSLTKKHRIDFDL